MLSIPYRAYLPNPCCHPKKILFQTKTVIGKIEPAHQKRVSYFAIDVCFLACRYAHFWKPEMPLAAVPCRCLPKAAQQLFPREHCIVLFYEPLRLRTQLAAQRAAASLSKSRRIPRGLPRGMNASLTKGAVRGSGASPFPDKPLATFQKDGKMRHDIKTNESFGLRYDLSSRVVSEVSKKHFS